MASATGGPRTLTGSSHSWKGVGHSWRRLGEAWLPDALDAPTREGMREGEGVSAAPSPLLLSFAGPGGHGQEAHLPGWLATMQGGAYLRGSHSLKGAEEGKAGLLRAPWPRMAFCGPGKEQKGAVNPLRSPKRHPCEGGGEV